MAWEPVDDIPGAPAPLSSATHTHGRSPRGCAMQHPGGGRFLGAPWIFHPFAIYMGQFCSQGDDFSSENFIFEELAITETMTIHDLRDYTET